MLQVGQIIHDRYQLQQKLGQNAGRQTWLAADLAAQAEPVIVKLLAFGDQVQWDDLKLFEREAQILRQVEHSRIPKYRDYFSIDDRLLWFGLVYGYIPGVSLKQLIDDGKRFSEEDIQRIAIAVLEILSDLHQLNPPVLHRDIKPSNLILGKDDQIYLVDFGAVQDKAAKEGATFTVVGTYGYTPMEQFGGRAVPASDLYALGATLIHLLTGTSPADLPQRNLCIQFRDRVSLTPQFENWLDQLTHPAVEQRLSSARDAIEALKFQSLGSVARETLAKIERPRNTQVRLQKSKYQLEIIIPKRHRSDRLDASAPSSVGLSAVIQQSALFFTILAIALVVIPVFIFTWIAIFNFSFWFILFCVAMSLLFMNPYFEQTRICFDREQFTIEAQRFGSATSRLIGVTADIRDIYQASGVIKIISGPYRTGYRQDEFGRELTDFERAWLVQEVKRWVRSNRKRLGIEWNSRIDERG
jgi:serine/threonine protein kinase